MNRREFTKTLGGAAVVIGLNRRGFASAASAPQFAITMDDFSWRDLVHLTGAQRNQAILDTLTAKRTRAALFVRASNIDNVEGKALLKAWSTAGHLIGNHTYSHREFNNAAVTAKAFGADILRSEALLRNFSRFQKYFRFPYLKEGDTPAKRDAIRAFLAQHGYRNGHVTIDASDWAVDARLRQRLEKNPSADLTPYRDFYLAHMWDRALYYDDLSRRVLGRSVKHTLLTHFNLLNALFLGDLIEMFKRNGWQLIDAEEAFSDSVFSAQPKIVPAGESLIWALAKETGKFEQQLRYPGEDGEYEKAKMDKLGL